MIGTVLVSSAATIAAWFTANFVGKPVLTLRDRRAEALQIAERYSHVCGFTAPDELRKTALKELHDSGNALLAITRAGSLAHGFGVG